MMGEGNKRGPDSRLYSIEETLEICLQDRAFYDESGGGVTLSGGEVMTQPRFAAALLDALKREGVHSALESSGFASPEVFADLAERADLLLFDIKHYDDRRHLEGTGVHNGPILENLKSALTHGRNVLPRLPVIPGYNDSLADARGFAVLLVSLGMRRVQLMPFHQFGERKYDLLQLPYAMRGVPQLHREDLETFRAIIAEKGIDCFF
jgi:pyruvate formate lyase activating enzyme